MTRPRLVPAGSRRAGLTSADWPSAQRANGPLVGPAAVGGLTGDVLAPTLAEPDQVQKLAVRVGRFRWRKVTRSTASRREALLRIPSSSPLTAAPHRVEEDHAELVTPADASP